MTPDEPEQATPDETKVGEADGAPTTTIDPATEAPTPAASGGSRAAGVGRTVRIRSISRT